MLPGASTSMTRRWPRRASKVHASTVEGAPSNAASVLNHAEVSSGCPSACSAAAVHARPASLCERPAMTSAAAY
jgi:hypothetical protein